MEEEKSKKVSLSTIFLIFAIIVIGVMGYFMYQLYNDKIKTNTEIENLKNTINNLQEKIESDKTNKIEDNSNEDNTDKTGEITPPQNEKTNDDIIGTWKTYQAHNVEIAQTISDLTEIFGTSYITYGSYLKLNEDGTFLDAIYPVTSGEESVEGTYTIEKDYYKPGDCYVFLNYSDGRTRTFMIIYYEDNIPILSCFETGDTYQFDLKK